jgi:hypothetical protein
LGSGGAHETHFKVVDEIIIKLFNYPEDQPKEFWIWGAETEPLEHVFTVIERQTLRGRNA